MTETAKASDRADTRTRIVDVAARLLRDEGPVAVTTRGVAQAAGVQAPTIYRIFGDKEGLLEAVAETVMEAFVSAKAAVVADAEAGDIDPLVDLRAGWTAQLEFGLSSPALFSLLNDPLRVRHSPSAKAGQRVLEARLHRVALTGRLRVSESRAVDMISSAGVGAITTTLARGPVGDERASVLERYDLGTADAMYEAVLAQILTDAPARPAADAGVLAAAVALRAVAPSLESLSVPERELLGEWLDREIAARQ